MTQYDYFRDHIDELAEWIKQTMEFCKTHDEEFADAFKLYMNSKRGYNSNKVQRDSDTTVIVNVGFVFNLHGLGAPSDKTEFETAKGYFEQVTKDVITYGTNSETVKYMRTYSPDDITFGETQIFHFGGDSE